MSAVSEIDDLIALRQAIDDLQQHRAHLQGVEE